ncbi:uncharacterized protein LOC143299620 [Babylonia areolata]|uniref:uncharacterized protein LOC143299620 n=1 Tax=Babylonia areolata TaxID=304850 RepID=UPI003FD08011
MTHLRASMVFITLFALTWSFAAATELHCFIGEEICSRWRKDPEAEHGLFNKKVVCCPPEPHQSITFNNYLKEPYNCVCNVGTAEKYDNVGKSDAAALVVGPGVVCVAFTTIASLLVVSAVAALF